MILLGFSNEIKGIRIDERNTVKLTLYADDTTVFLREVQPLKNLFNLLAQFEFFSGLRINPTKSELLWLGSLRYGKDTLLNIRLDVTIYLTKSIIETGNFLRTQVDCR